MHQAIIDFGSNTIRLTVYEVKDGQASILVSLKETVGLIGYVENGVLAPEGLKRACDALGKLRNIALRFVAKNDLHVFATASLRGLCDQKQVIAEITDRTHLKIDVISGTDEAFLAYKGATSRLDCPEGILTDIGGASTEIVVFEDHECMSLTSLPIGCLSLYTRFVDDFLPSAKERRILSEEVERYLSNLTSEGARSETLIGVGGTVRAANKLAKAFFNPDGPNSLSAENVSALLLKLEDPDKNALRTLYKLVPDRVLTIVPGLMILEGVMQHFGCTRMIISKAGVRDGYLFERVLRTGDSSER